MPQCFPGQKCRQIFHKLSNWLEAHVPNSGLSPGEMGLLPKWQKKLQKISKPNLYNSMALSARPISGTSQSYPDPKCNILNGMESNSPYLAFPSMHEWKLPNTCTSGNQLLPFLNAKATPLTHCAPFANSAMKQMTTCGDVKWPKLKRLAQHFGSWLNRI